MRVTFFQRTTGGAPATGITHTVTAASESGLSVTPPTVVEIGASSAPGWYYFDISPTARTVITTDAGSGVHGDLRYQAFLVDPDAADTKTAVSEAVWDEARSGHVTAGTFGEGFGLQVDSTLFWRLLSTTYTGSPARPTSLIIAAYPTKADADADTNRLYTQTVEQTFDATGQLVTSKKTRI